MGCRQHGIDGEIGQRIDAFVTRISGVALDPLPGEVVLGRKLIQLLPQILVLHRLAIRGAPAPCLPGGQPLGDALDHVLRVGVYARLARCGSRPQVP